MIHLKFYEKLTVSNSRSAVLTTTTAADVVAAVATADLSSAGGERLQLLLGPRPPRGGERDRVEGGGTGGSGEGKGLGLNSSNEDSNGR